MKSFFEINKKTGAVQNRVVTDIQRANAAKGTYIWVDFDESTEKNETKGLLSSVFGFHPWTISQSLGTTQRPKLEEHDDYLFIIMPSLVKGNGEQQTFTKLSIFIGKDFVVTVHDKPLQSIIDVKREIVKQEPSFHDSPDEILYQLLTEIVDDYRPIIEHLDSEVDLVEQSIFKTADPVTQQKIFGIKKKVLALRRSVQPLREVISLLTNRELNFISDKGRLMFRDTYDHILRVYDELEAFRELMSSAMDSYISQVSNRLNEIMKILSVVATIILPLTLITGIWGTNFVHLPGLHSPHGFWYMIISMAVLSFLMLLFFRWRKWF